MLVRICDPSDYTQIYDLCLAHNKFSRRPLRARMTQVDVNNILGNNLIFGCFKEDQLISFMVTKKLLTVPAWYMTLVVCRTGNTRFNAATNGIAVLYDYAIKYWEDDKIYNFIYVQPASFTKSANTRQHSVELQRYNVFTMHTILKNKKTDFPFINSFVGNIVSPVDQVVRWCYRNE